MQVCRKSLGLSSPDEAAKDLPRKVGGHRRAHRRSDRSLPRTDVQTLSALGGWLHEAMRGGYCEKLVFTEGFRRLDDIASPADLRAWRYFAWGSRVGVPNKTDRRAIALTILAGTFDFTAFNFKMSGCLFCAAVARDR